MKLVSALIVVGAVAYAWYRQRQQRDEYNPAQWTHRQADKAWVTDAQREERRRREALSA
jgi:uncharacterized membrane protein YebE (DUF533 family)